MELFNMTILKKKKLKKGIRRIIRHFDVLEYVRKFQLAERVHTKNFKHADRKRFETEGKFILKDEINS